jgi:hypothetical protein
MSGALGLPEAIEAVEEAAAFIREHVPPDMPAPPP